MQAIQILQQINVKKCPFCIQHRDSNSWPSEYEYSHLTTGHIVWVQQIQHL